MRLADVDFLWLFAFLAVLAGIICMALFAGTGGKIVAGVVGGFLAVVCVVMGVQEWRDAKKTAP